MKNSRFMKCVLLFMTILFLQTDVYGSNGINSNDNGEKEDVCLKIKLRDYEPNMVGFRKDDNDDTHVNFIISQMYPLFHNGCKPSQSDKKWWVYPYFAFTGEFGFYALGGRDSRPVIGKRFNPKVFFRIWENEAAASYFDFGYAHESNGQSTNTQSAYLQKRSEIMGRGERAEFANDYLSRGWDYWELSYNREWYDTDLFLGDNTLYVKLKWLLKHGLLQEDAEEYFSWETNDGKLRREVDGITIQLKTSDIEEGKPGGMKAALTYTTGSDDVFENNSVKVEMTFKLGDLLPATVWVSQGYNSDLADYYRDVTAFGLAFELRNFLSDI